MFLGFLDGWLRSEGGVVAVASARAILLLTVGLLVAKAAGRLIDRFGHRLTPQHRMVFRRMTVYLIVGLAIVSALREFGFDLSVLLGAAGLLTVAVGFASQTSMSNVISGLFLIGERPFVIGDVIRIGQTIGEVVEIGLVSVQIRTFDNLKVRIPNEQIFKGEIANFSEYPIRRIDIGIQVGRGEDLAQVRRILLTEAGAIPGALEEPKPAILFREFTADGVDLLFSVWVSRARMTDVQNALYEGIHDAFVREGIRLPAPHRTVVGLPVLPPVAIDGEPSSTQAPPDAGPSRQA